MKADSLVFFCRNFDFPFFFFGGRSGHFLRGKPTETGPRYLSFVNFIPTACGVSAEFCQGGGSGTRDLSVFFASSEGMEHRFHHPEII